VVAHFGIPVRAHLTQVAQVPEVALTTPIAPKARGPIAKPRTAPQWRAVPAPVRLAPARASRDRRTPARAVPKARIRNILARLAPRSVGDLIVMREHDVDAKFVADVDVALDADVATVDIVALRDHDVPPAYLARLKSAGVRSKCGFDFVRLHDHGVTPRVVALLQRRLGLKNKMTIEQLVRMAEAGT
jgi:hypothetical protein